ncbi:MAG TPA: alkaline phosphatase family protein [Bacteroidota bacterium]|nr:alkaline phosphatase family protein [Bacteroidota bacterium]
MSKMCSAQTLAWPDSLPVFDHVVIVIEENKDYEEIVDNASAPYINTLVHEGANFTHMYAEEHKSEGNYFWLMSGDNQNVGFNDATPPGMIFAPNIGEQLIDKGLTFKGYSEDLPEIGSTVSLKYPYARKHVPWVSFGNLPGGSDPDSSTNLQFAQFPADFTKLPTVSFVIPNLINDMHDDPDNVVHGDVWLRKNMDAYYQWAKNHNSLLIITFDENEDPTKFAGPTDPSSSDKVMQNRIATIFAGAHIKHGDYAEGKGITHVNVLRTLEAMYGLPTCGRQLSSALKFGIPSDYIITDVFEVRK